MTSSGSRLFILVQQLAHLVDGKRLILPGERFLAFAFIQERPVICILTGGDFLAGLRSIVNAARILIRIRRSGIGVVMRKNIEDAALAVKRLRIELPGRKLFCGREILLIRLLLDVKTSDVCSFVDRRAVSDKFLVLRTVVQIHIRLEQAINKLLFLILRPHADESRENQDQREKRYSHTWTLPDSGGCCKANLLLAQSDAASGILAGYTPFC